MKKGRLQLVKKQGRRQQLVKKERSFHLMVLNLSISHFTEEPFK